jgi:hypothetical protein
MLFLKAKIAVSGLLAAAAVAGGVGATPASAATETVTVTIQVTHNSVTLGAPNVLFGFLGQPLRCLTEMADVPQQGPRATPTFQVVASQGATIRVISVTGCYGGGGIGGYADVVADATKTVQVSL